MDISEKSFEQHIEDHLFSVHGYRKRNSQDHYDRTTCLDWELLLEFITATQPDTWKALVKQHGSDVEKKFIYRLTKEITRRGTLNVLRKGIKDYGCYFDLAYFAPASSLNPNHIALYSKNIFSVLRQCYYSEKHQQKAIDMVIFLNGLPILTMELKNNLTNGHIADAMEQYRKRRNPKGEPLLQFKRCLVHFLVDDDLVYMTTRLQGERTHFLPFNQGNHGGQGNPINPHGYASAYLWEKIWKPENLLELIGHFIHLEVTEENGIQTEKLIFPRYHQWDVVRKLVAHAKTHETGQNYLIQHSAGSGKSNSIAWLTHRLSTLHNDHNERVFDTVLVITDRRVLDRQLRDTVRQFEQTSGVVTVIDKHSGQLREALEAGANIVVTTLQKFPAFMERLEKDGQFQAKGSRFAIIIDEAHSSQSGESSKSMKHALQANSLEEAEHIDSEGELTDEDLINQSIEARGKQPNLSFFAFTATPKQKTIELFGVPQPDGSFEPFHVYSMRQAIEEGFILDVLQNYITFTTYFNVLKKIQDDPQYEKRQAVRLMKRYVDLHEFTIAQRTTIMVEHFWENIRRRIPDEHGQGQAKAMVVTRSRLHAVRYKQAFDAYLKRQNYPIKALVAFSGTVTDSGIDYTESQMNGFSDTQTAERFKKPEYRFLIVAEKFQTGFDQPFLQTMYVDKIISSVRAVQTLSRLNRIHPGKNETMVLDFANNAEDIQNAFAPYYETTVLSENTDPNKLYDLQTALADFSLYSESEVARIAKLFLRKGEKAEKLQPLLKMVRNRYQYISDSTIRADFKHKLTQYIHLYAFLSQVLTFKDPDLERLYLFARLLIRKLPPEKELITFAVHENIDLESYRIEKASNGRIPLGQGQGELEPLADFESVGPDDKENARLSQIIAEINERFGTDFTEADRVFFAELKTRLATNDSLQESAKVNSRENVELLFNSLFNVVLQGMIDSNFEMFKRINDDQNFGDNVRKLVFEQVYQDISKKLELKIAPK